MGENLGAEWAREWMRRAAAEVAVRRIDLIELDRAIGDGDHGENLDRGFAAVLETLDPEAETVGAVLRGAASALISRVGGAAGPLYGTALLRAAKAAGDLPALDGGQVAELLRAALAGIMERGKATVGEKTMVDAWAPAVAAARSLSDGATPTAVLFAAAEAAATGALATEPLVATKGRASYLGERSAGHRDPGAESSAIILRAAADAAAAGGLPGAGEPGGQA